MSMRDIEAVMDRLQREEGFFAAIRYSCCLEHGLQQLVSDDLVLPHEPYAFTTHKDEHEWRNGGAGLWIAFGPDVETGQILVRYLRKAKLRVEWDGTLKTRAKVIMTSPGPMVEV